MAQRIYDRRAIIAKRKRNNTIKLYAVDLLGALCIFGGFFGLVAIGFGIGG